jgi:hypothetical protein
VAHRREGAVRLEDLHRHGVGGHRDHLAIVDVGRRVAGVEGQLADHEAPRGGDGVAPGDVLVEADVDQRESVDRRAHRVVTARDGEVDRVKAVDAKPREVGIPEQGATAVVGELAAECHGVAAELVHIPFREIDLREQALRLREVDRRGVRLRRLRCRQGGGRRRCDDRIDEVGDTRAQRQLGQRLQDVELVDGPHPGGVSAGCGEPRDAGVPQVSVVASRVAAQELLAVAVELLPAALYVLVRVVERPHEIALKVSAVRAEEARELAVGLDDVFREHAEVVARERVALAIAEAAPVARADVGNALGGPAYIGVVRGPARRGTGRADQCGECESRESDDALGYGHHGPPSSVGPRRPQGRAGAARLSTSLHPERRSQGDFRRPSIPRLGRTTPRRLRTGQAVGRGAPGDGPAGNASGIVACIRRALRWAIAQRERATSARRSDLHSKQLVVSGEV